MTKEMPDPQTESQLKVLAEISAFAENLEIEFWLRGGWAIDFLFGKITRQHDDIDLVTWIENRELLEKELVKAGYEQMPVKQPFQKRQSDFRKNHVDVSVGYITASVNGSLILNGLPEWIWQPDALLPKYFRLCGISVKVLNPKQLLEEKEIYEQIDRRPRPKDQESKKVLRQIIEG